MYKAFCDACEKVLKIPAPPEPPPGHEETTQIFRAAPNFLKYLLAMWAIRAALIVGAAAIALLAIAIPNMMGRNHSALSHVIVLVLDSVAFVVVLITQLWGLAIVRLDYEKRWYVVTDRSLRVREGIVNLREMTVNFANIQNISISQGPIQRMLNIADLRVDTAGGGGGGPKQGNEQMYNLHTAFFRGVNNANEIRELIQARLRHLKDSGLGDHEEVAAASKASSTEEGLIVALREVHEEARRLNSALQMS